MSDAMCDIIYEEESEQWREAVTRAVRAKEFDVARAMVKIGPKVTTGKSKWTKTYVEAWNQSIKSMEENYTHE